jgi:MFS family permease
MTAFRDLFKHEPSAKLFFAAHAQSSLGTGAGYVALLVLAYERFASPWAITLVLLADFFPGMFLGPLFGAAADRWSRRSCAVAGDLARAAAFISIGFVGDFGATIALALVAGTGTGLFRPAVLAGLPSLVDSARLPAATSLYGALDDLGHTLGPVITAAAFALATPEAVLVANGVTFALSALLLMRLSFDGFRDRRTHRRESVVRSMRDGLAEASRMRGVRAIVLSSSAVVLFAGLFNVGELLLAIRELHTGPSGFSILIAVFGLGVVAGSLVGSRGGTLGNLKQRYLLGLSVVGVGFLASGFAPTFPAALGGFALAGLGNGLVVVHERLLLQQTVPNRTLGRVFGIKDSLTAWAFAIAFVSAGAIASLVGTRPLLLAAGGGVLVVLAAASLSLRTVWTDSAPAASAPAHVPGLAAS